MVLLLSLLTHITILLLIEFKEFHFSKRSISKIEEKRLRVFLVDEIDLPKQIVETERSNNKLRDPLTRFLGKDTQKVDKQMVSKNIGKFRSATKGSDQENSNQSNKRFKLSDLSIQRNKIFKRKNFPKKGIMGESASNDYITDVSVGDKTELNTVEYIYYGFYHRIKQKLDQYWAHSVSTKINHLWRTNRYTYEKNRMTYLIVTLDDMGNLIKIKIKGSSGLDEIDQAAIDSFKRAEPFPNPPKGMVKNGEVQIKWAFVIL
ncbi:MAG: energy transducer TonB [Bacteriovoracaceae bacterium]|nr:energy transducer TonB [Bacteriovoracaceae bacterium]